MFNHIKNLEDWLAHMLPQSFDAMGLYETHVKENDDMIHYVGRYWTFCGLYIALGRRKDEDNEQQHS